MPIHGILAWTSCAEEFPDPFPIANAYFHKWRANSCREEQAGLNKSLIAYSVFD